MAQLHREEDNLECGADDILVAPGSKMLLYLAMRLFHGGEGRRAELKLKSD